MSLRLPWLVLASVAALLALASGCASKQVVASAGSFPWSGLGLKLSLPAGSWEIEEVQPDRVVMFRRLESAAHLVLMRVPAREEESADLALMRLFAHFKDKTELARHSRSIPSGLVANFAEYSVAVDGRTLRVLASVFRGGEWTTDLVAWGMDKDTFDAVADSLAFEN